MWIDVRYFINELMLHQTEYIATEECLMIEFKQVEFMVPSNNLLTVVADLHMLFWLIRGIAWLAASHKKYEAMTFAIHGIDEISYYEFILFCLERRIILGVVYRLTMPILKVLL
jgi:hypothetical protein